MVSEDFEEFKTTRLKLRPLVVILMGHTVAQLVEALRYKPEGREFDSPWYHCKFHWHNPPSCTMALGPTKPLTEMIPAILGASTTYVPKDQSRPVKGISLTFTSNIHKFF